MRSLPIAILLLSGAAPAWPAQPSSCAPVPEDGKKTISEYVRKKYKLPDTVSLTLSKESLVPGTCFHELTFQGRSSLRQWDLKLYLSPDARYLTSDLMDTHLDPAEEERRKAKALMSGLAENKGASMGPESAPVTIVEFSDFECPYCRKLADMLREVLSPQQDRVRVVFHHMPLSMHQWARAAAEGAACAQLQNGRGFWTLHDQLFHEQDQITADNVKAKLVQFAQTIKELDLAAFQNCLDNEMSLGLVFRDMDLASSNEVKATPTLFINGHRVQGVKDLAHLRELIAEAEKEAP
jgi:protein-disulfide isomerase